MTQIRVGFGMLQDRVTGRPPTVDEPIIRLSDVDGPARADSRAYTDG